MRIPGRRAIGQYCYFLPRTHTSTSVQGPVAASCGSGSPPPTGMVWYGMVHLLPPPLHQKYKNCHRPTNWDPDPIYNRTAMVPQ